MADFDFKGLASLLLARSGEFLLTWAPGGQRLGREYAAGTIRGGPGDSFKANLETGAWIDFATGEKGGDLISLYAAVENIKQGEAAKRLSAQLNYPLNSDSRIQEAARPKAPSIGIPPLGVIVPPMIHRLYGKPSGIWCYKQSDGNPIFYEARYDTTDGKQFAPWSWDTANGKWICKGYPEPRPLYGLDMLRLKPSAPVMIVEGPKCAEAARIVAGHTYAIVTWPNGAASVEKANWEPVFGRKVLIWPDADEPGISAANKISGLLVDNCSEVKILDVKDMPAKWDVVDAIAQGWDWKKIREWAVPRAQLVPRKTQPVATSTQPIINLTQINIHSPESEDQPAPALASTYENKGISVNSSGKPYCNVDNALRVLQRCEEFKDLIWYDEFHHRYFTSWNSAGRPREWADVDTLNLTAFLQRSLGFHQMSDEVVHKAAIIYAHGRVRNEPRDWMNGLTWDGIKRIDSFFWDCFWVEESEYSHAIGGNFWVGMVARILTPGCQLDNMVVLEGLQGIGKTKALRAIGGPWYTEAHESVTSNDFFMILHGKLIIEIAELDSFSKAEVTRIKQVITSTTDRYRAPYGRVAQDYPRMSIFVGTTNEESYLKDNTGARRFWPLRCASINLSRIEENREQFFAEAVAKFKAGNDWYKMPQKITEEQQERRRHIDEWEGQVREWLIGKTDNITIRDVAVEALKIEIGRLDRSHQLRIARVLSTLGWEKRFELSLGIAVNIWRKKISEELPLK